MKTFVHSDFLGHTFFFCCRSDLLSLGNSPFGVWGRGGFEHSYITDRLNKIFPCHYVQYLLEVDLLDINQSNHSLMGAVCVVCRVCVCGHIPERSIGWWSPSLDFDHQTSSSSTLALIETTSWSDSLMLSSSLTPLLVPLPTSSLFLFFLSNFSFLLSNLIFYLFFLRFPLLTLIHNLFLFTPPKCSAYSFFFSTVAPFFFFSYHSFRFASRLDWLQEGWNSCRAHTGTHTHPSVSISDGFDSKMFTLPKFVLSRINDGLSSPPVSLLMSFTH